ncbi:hypothetical protein [Morganella morganii IS15]|nr:hypothetical protein CSB69_2252 [Morganella morganii]EMP50408.1 hypothetical protein C790_02288 [Morganella morganii SC01]CDK66554.1 hypothetical protein [Morganella morganii IS15]
MKMSNTLTILLAPYVKAWINSVVKIHEAVTFQFRLIIVVAVARRRGQQSFIY